MDRVVKIIWAISVTSMVFVACNKGGGGAQVNGPRNRNGQLQNKNQTNTQTQNKQTIDPNQMTDAQKATALDVKWLRPMFRDAASLYGDAWKAIVKSNPTQSPKKENVGNMLKLISEILEANFDKAGTPYAKVGATATSNKGSNGAGKPASNVQVSGPCQAPGFSSVRPVTELKSTYDVYYAPCDKGANGEKKIATINRNSKGDQTFSVTWDISTLDSSPDRMMGVFLPVSKDKNSLSSGCDLESMLEGHLGAMSCQNLGQDISQNEYALVTSFDFKNPKNPKFDASQTAHPVVMEFKEFTHKDDNTEEERAGRMIDDPVSNSLVVNMQGAPKDFATDISKAQSTSGSTAAAKAEQARQQKEKEDKDKAQQQQQQQQDAGNQDGSQQGQDAPAASPDPKTAVVPAGVQQQSQQPSNSQQQYDDGTAAVSDGADSSQNVGPSTSRDASAITN